MRSEFEKTNTFKSIYSTLMYFDEGLNVYISNNSLRKEDAIRLSYAWWGYQEQQAKVDELQKQVDVVKQLIQSYKDEEKELKHKEWEQSTIYGRVAIELEQALKGGEA